MLQVRLFGLRDKFCGVEILETAGGFYDPSIGDGSRGDWYSRNTGQLYISHFKKQGSAAGRPYDFMIKEDMRKAVDDTHAPGAPRGNRKYLVDVGIGRPNTDKASLPLPVGIKIRDAFSKVDSIASPEREMT